MRTDRRRPSVGSIVALLSGVLLFFATVWLAPEIGVSAVGATSIAPNPAAVHQSSDCPSTALCISIPCKHKGSCPTVEASPVTQLGIDQWVYLSLSHFPAGYPVQVDYCSDTKPPSPKHTPLCDLTSTAALPDPQEVLPIFPNGTAVTSFDVGSDPHQPGNTALAGIEPGTEPAKTGSFYCDDGPDFCSIDIIDPELSATGALLPAADNTIVIPVRFQPSSNGCPGAEFMFTSSDFSVEQLFPHEAPFACAGSHPVIPIDTAADSSEALASLTSGSAQMTFLTDPLSPDVAGALAKTKTHYWYIPVAASAVVIGYDATMEEPPGSFYGYDSERLTPAQVAGLITFNYSTPNGNDLVRCPASVVTALNGGFPEPAGPCPLLEGMNAVNGFGPAQQYGAFIPAYHSGLTRELVSWICEAPAVPVSLGGKMVKDPAPASRLLTTSVFDSKWPIKSCTPFDQFPAVPSPSGAQYALLASPAVQAKFLRSYLPAPQFETSPQAAFLPMDWSEATYQGLDVAALQNAAGNFMSPSAESIDDALVTAKVGPDGILEPDFSASSKYAYPMPEVTYAVVPAPKTQSEVTEDAGLLDSLLAYTGGAGSTNLPQGFVPLPAKLYQQALVDVQKDIAVPKPVSHKGGGTGTTGGGTPPTTTTTIPVAPPTTTTTVPTPIRHHKKHPVTHPTRPPAPPKVIRTVKPPAVIHYSPVPLVASGARWTLPVVAMGGSVSLVPGGVLLLFRRLRRTRKR